MKTKGRPQEIISAVLRRGETIDTIFLSWLWYDFHVLKTENARLRNEAGQPQNFNMTDLYYVIEIIIGLIPAKFEKHEELVGALTHLKDGLVYKSPELLYEQWERLCYFLNLHVGAPADREWALQIRGLVTGEGEK